MSDNSGIGRREFLVLSAAGTLAAATLGPNLFAADAAAAPKRLAVGYAPPDELSALVAASSIPSGDGAFIRHGARVAVSGASGVSDPHQRRTVELLVNYFYWDGGTRKEAPFRAWACSRASACQGNPVKFTVPVDEMQKISFNIGVDGGAPSAAAPAGRQRAVAASPMAPADETLPVTLSLLSDPSSLKLVRGFYVIVPLYDNDSEPRWSAWTLDRRDGRWALHDRDGNVAPFEHFVLKIDYAA